MRDAVAVPTPNALFVAAEDSNDGEAAADRCYNELIESTPGCACTPGTGGVVDNAVRSAR